MEAFTKDCFSGTPKPARETRALPKPPPSGEGRPRLLLSADLTDRANKFGEIFAVARGVIERLEPRIYCCFGQRDAASGALAHELVIQAALKIDIVILEID